MGEVLELHPDGGPEKTPVLPSLHADEDLARRLAFLIHGALVSLGLSEDADLDEVLDAAVRRPGVVDLPVYSAVWILRHAKRKPHAEVQGVPHAASEPAPAAPDPHDPADPTFELSKEGKPT
jgi:hypothetical protein